MRPSAGDRYSTPPDEIKRAVGCACGAMDEKNKGHTVISRGERCGRAGQYRKATLIDRYGADVRLPDLRDEIAQCKRRHTLGDACRVHYGGLS